MPDIIKDVNSAGASSADNLSVDLKNNINKKSIAAKHIYASFESSERKAKDAFSRLPIDTLIINDLTFDQASISNISIENSSDVLIAETLRTSSPIVKPKGRGTEVVTIELAFPEGLEQSVVLRRLCSELLYHPFVFIENKRIREVVSPSSHETMMFVLHNASMHTSAQNPGVIFMSLQLAVFNYKPFSNHFWYNTHIPGEPSEGIKRNLNIIPDFSQVSPSSDYDMLLDTIYRLAFDDDAESVNTPSVFPINSKAWMYYADTINETFPPAGEENSDFIKFMWKEYTLINPPMDARSGTGTPGDFFSSDDTKKTIKPWYNATKNASSYATGYSGGTTHAERYSAKLSKVTSSGGGKLIQAKFSGGVHENYYITDRDRLFMGKLIAGEHWTWTERDAARKSSGFPFMMWAVMHKFMCVPGFKNYSFARFLHDFSEPIKRKSWMKPGALDETHPKYQHNRNKMRTQTATWKDIPFTIRNFVNEFAAGKIPKPTVSGEILGSNNRFNPGSASVAKYSDFATHKFIMSKGGYSKYSSESPPFKYKGNVYVLNNEAKNINSVAVHQQTEGPSCDGDITIVDGNPAAVEEAYKPKPIEQQECRDVDESEKDYQDSTVDHEQKYKVEEKKREDSKPSAVKRIEWIRQQQKQYGLNYYSGDSHVRNLFYKDVSFSIGGENPDLTNVAVESVSVQFGHRLAQMKILSQEKASWQFLGAGNRSGTISLVAADDIGRASIREIKRMISVVSYNAHSFKHIKDSSSISISTIDIDSRYGINNVLSMINANDIVVTNTTEETSVKEGIDIHRLVIEFVVQEFESPRLKQKDTISLSTKMSMIKSILSCIDVELDKSNYKDLESTGNWWDDFKDILETIYIKGGSALVVDEYLVGEKPELDDSVENFWAGYGWAKQYQFLMSKLRELRDRHKLKAKEFKDSKEIPDNFKDLARKAISAIYEIKNDVPFLNIPVTGVEPRLLWEQKIANDLGPWAPILIGGVGLLNGKIKGWNFHKDYTQASMLMSRLYRTLLSKLNTIVVDSIRFARDKQNFIDYFGPRVYNDIMSSVAGDLNTCYKDLKYPNIPGTSIPLPPEYYVYDDSLENAVLGYYNDDVNLERMIKSHILNQTKSIEHITSNAILGGAYVSANMALIKKTKLDLNEKFGVEYGYQSLLPPAGFLNTAGQTLLHYLTAGLFSTRNVANIEGSQNLLMADGARTTSNFILDLMMPEEDKKEMLNAYASNSYSDFKGGTLEQKAADGFLNSVIAMSPHLYKFSSDTYKGKLLSASRDKLYSDLKSHLYDVENGGAFDYQTGPNVLESRLDATKRGDMCLPDPGTRQDDISSDLAPGDLSKNTNPVYPPAPPAATKSTADLLAKTGARISVENRKKDLSMRRAYPTFKIYFIEEDSEQSSKQYRAFDDFYSYSAIQEIRVIRSRKVPADLAIIRMSNISGILFRKRFGESLIDEIEISEGKGPSEDATGILGETNNEHPFNKIIMQDGVKVQIRLGYNSDPDLLESVFLGQVVEVQPTEDSEMLEIVCQGYGAELDAARCGDGEDESYFYSTQHALNAAIMQPFVGNFGRRQLNVLYNPAEIRNAWTGGLGEDLFEINIFDRAVQTTYTEMIKRTKFLNLPQDDNIFAPPPATYLTGYDRFWNNAGVYRPIGVTPWEIFKEHELRHPGYVSLAVPYGHSTRMTMFFGARGQNYWSAPMSEYEEQLIDAWGEYLSMFSLDDLLTNPIHAEKRQVLKNKNRELWNALVRSGYRDRTGDIRNLGFHLGRIFGRYKPFRNFHLFTSEHHILKNNIRTSVHGTYNTVEVRYSETENIVKEYSNGAEMMNAKNEIASGEDGVITLKLSDNIPEHLVRKHTAVFPSCVTSTMAKRYGQGLLIQGLKDTYKGELIVIGEETLKPYDICQINDITTDMHGPIEVEQVIHVFNRNFGFISIITPDLCVDFNEMTSKGWMDSVVNTMSLMYISGSDVMRGQLSRKFPVVKDKVMGGLFPLIGAITLIHWDQTASPFITTPLHFGGKPFISVTTAPKFASTITSLWGKWIQWWEDLEDGFDRTDFTEAAMDTGWSIMDWAGSFFSASQSGDSDEAF